MKPKTRNKITKSFLGMLIMLCALFIPSIEAKADVTYAPPGYHIEYWGDGCCSRGGTEVHNIYEKSRVDFMGPCAACSQTVQKWKSESGYDCSSKGFVLTGGNENIYPGTYDLGLYCSGTSWDPWGTVSGSVTCDDHIEYYCGGHLVANTYYLQYVSNDSGARGFPQTQTCIYDRTYYYYGTSGFSRVWTVDFLGNVGEQGSTVGTTTSVDSVTTVASWSRGSLGGAFSNLTTVNGGTVTTTPNWNPFPKITVPAVTKEGYNLAGYTNVKANAGVKPNGDTSQVTLKVGDQIVPTGPDNEWYAIWVPKEYNISFDVNTLKYDTTHSTSISGKNFNEFYETGTSNKTTTSGSTPTITVKFDGTIQIPTSTFKKSTTGYYGQTVNYTLIGWSQSKFSNFNSASRTSSADYVRDSGVAYYGYYNKTGLRNLAFANYITGDKNVNSIYYYPNEKILNYSYNGKVRNYNLSNGTYNVTLYANWIAENQRPYTYFRLATRDYRGDGTSTGYIENLVYDKYPTSIYNYNTEKAIVYDDMPIYLNTIYYDPEGRVDDGQFRIEYQYSIDNGVTWYKLDPNITTPNFKTSLVSFNTNYVANSKDLDDYFVLNNTKARNIIFGNNQTNTTTATYALEIVFVSEEAGKTTLIRSRARDTVDYPVYLTNVTRNESTHALTTSTENTLQKPLWSTGYEVNNHTSTPRGTYVDDYTGAANSWNGQKAFKQNTTVGKTTGDNAGWYTKTIVCYEGNSADKIDPDFDNAGSVYPMYDYTNGNLFIEVSNDLETQVEDNFGETTVATVLEQRGYVKTMDNGAKMDYRHIYADKTTILRESQSHILGEDNINRKYSDYPNADESIGFINLSIDKDNYKHYTEEASPTHDIDKNYPSKYFHLGNSLSSITYNNQFSLYFISILDQDGQDVLTQAGASEIKQYDTNGVPINGSLYTVPGTSVTGHVYTTYQNMVNDIYAKTNSMFSEKSDVLNGTYTVYIGVCDKSWNLYSPNKWAVEKSTLIVEPRLSIVDIELKDFSQPNYKNDYLLDTNGNPTSTKVPTSLFLKSVNGETLTLTSGGVNYRFPMFKLDGYTQKQTINGNTIYVNNFSLTQKEQAKTANGNYIADTALGYVKPYAYQIVKGYNFNVSVEAINADYLELVVYDADGNVFSAIPLKDTEYIGDVTQRLLYNSTRKNSIREFRIALPEQGPNQDMHFALKIYKTTLTNTTHPTSSSAGTTTLTRNFMFAETNNILTSGGLGQTTPMPNPDGTTPTVTPTPGGRTYEILVSDDSILEDIGINLAD